ncbi:MAG: ABC transporter permease [Spirochaetaceae bacterium]|jgi:putative ABC transport system permease protein|nr:ABC transporter permease [Spirochaetaceae bacterium]
MIEGILTEGLVYGIMVLAVFITFRILNFADMTVDGSLPLGAAIMTVCMVNGQHTVIAFLLAFLGGAAAGFVTALIHTKLKIPDLLSGILTMTMLRSVILRVMSNRANIPLLRTNTVFTNITGWTKQFTSDPNIGIVVYCLLVVIVIKIALDLFFRTDLGLSLGALGSNPQLIISQGMNPDILKIIGICLANGLVAISGSLAAMYQGFADVSFGQGMIVSGLASLMLGEFLLRSNRIGLLTLRAIFGSILYRAMMYAARNYGYYIHMNPNDLNLMTGLLIIACILISKQKLSANFLKKPVKMASPQNDKN